MSQWAVILVAVAISFMAVFGSLSVIGMLLFLKRVLEDWKFKKNLRALRLNEANLNWYRLKRKGL